MEEENSLFLELEGDYDFSEKLGKYIFNLFDKQIFRCKTVNYIADPTYDSTFKILFGREDGKERLIDFINSIMFPNEEDEVKKLTYVNNEFPKLNRKKCKGVIRTDIACQIETLKKKKPFLLCIEMQIGNSGSFSKRLFNYSTSLRNDNFFKDCYSIGLYLSINDEYRGSNHINVIKTKNKGYKLNYINIIEIDINDEICNIKNDEPVIINNKQILNNGKEYIKLLGIRNWGSRDLSKYVLPDVSLLSSNEKFVECLKILGSISQNALSLMKVDEQSLLDEEQEKKDRKLIHSAFSLFITGSDPIDYLEKNVDLKDYSEHYIKSVLEYEKAKYVKNFIKLLNEYNLLMDSCSSSSD